MPGGVAINVGFGQADKRAMDLLVAKRNQAAPAGAAQNVDGDGFD